MTPVAVGVVDVAAARIEFEVGITGGIAGAANANAAPKRKDARVEDVAFIRPFRLEARTEDEDFPQVTAGGVEPSAGRGGEGRDLGGAGFDQIGEIVDAIDGKYVTAIAGAGEQTSVPIEAESVDEIFVGGPQARRRTIGRDAINFGAAGSADSGRGKRRRGGSCGDGDVAAGWGRVLPRCDRDAHSRGRSSGVLLSRSGGVDIAVAVDGEGGNFFLGRAVENERFAIWSDAIDQPAAIGAGNQIPFGICLLYTSRCV